jgi:hypothetical protein
MKMYIRSWGRHQRSATLPRMRRSPLLDIDTGQACTMHLGRKTLTSAIAMLQYYCCITSVLDGGEWLASRPGHFTRWEKALGAHWIESWVGSRAGLYGGEK